MAHFPLTAATYYWRGAGTGGNGDWSTGATTWYDSGTKVWTDGNAAVFGSPLDNADAGLGGVVTLKSNISALSLSFQSKANGYLLQGETPGRILTLTGTSTTGNISIAPVTTITLGANLSVTKAAQLHIDGGGKLIIGNGATVSNSSSFVNINGGATVEVKAGGTLNVFDTFIVGNTAAGNATTGTGTLLVSGGIVNAGTASSSNRNFIIGNRTGTIGDVTVTITAGEINVNPASTNGLVFENTGASSAYFNLNGGTVTARRVLRSGTSPEAGEDSQFNFNGGVLKVSGTATDALDANFAFLQGAAVTYNVREGGAIIDTNGRNVLIAVDLLHNTSSGTDGGFTKRGAGILQFHGTNTYDGGTKIEQGTLSIKADNNLGATPTAATPGNLVINDGATLRTTATMTLNVNRGIALGAATGAGAGTIEVQSGILTYAGVIANRGTGPGGLIKTGAGTLSLSGTTANTFSGPITVQGGILQAANASRLGSANNDPSNFVLDGGGFDFTGGGVVERGIRIDANGGTLYNTGAAWRLNGNIIGAGTLTIKATNGYISISGDNSAFTGNIDIVSGELQLRRAGNLGTAAGTTTVRSGAALSLDQNGTGGGGHVPADNNYKDALVLEDNATLRNKGGTGSDSIYSGTVALQSGMAIMDVVGKILTITSVISGDGGLNKTGAGNLILEGKNTYKGKTTVSAGTLTLGVDQTLGDDASIAASPWIQVNNGATFSANTANDYSTDKQVLSGRGTFLGNYLLSGTASIKPGDSTNQALSAIASAGNLTGSLTFTGNLTFSDNVAPTTRAVFGLGGGIGEYDQILVSGALTVGDNTKFEVTWVNAFEASWGDTFNLLDWTETSVSWGNFNPSSETFLDLPDFVLNTNLSWDTSHFMTDGTIRVVPEPSRALLILGSLSWIFLRRRPRAASA